ncbi:MAG: 30S ribosomal protein S9 [Planctomycetota bacterium]
MSDPTEVEDTQAPEGAVAEPQDVAAEEDATLEADFAVATPDPQAFGSAAHAAPSGYFWGTGRRKSSVARVRIASGSGNVSIKRSGNDPRELNDYFQNERDRKAIFGPLEVTQYGGKVDVHVNANGGGSTGQAEAIVMGLARALIKYDPQSEAALRENGFMTRDSRMKERKKYGQRGARRRFQFSKR